MKNPTHAIPTINDSLLFEHFATLATAPDGIARLRELILQLAVQGKLGTQDAGDEPASALIKRIFSERKNKKEKNSASETIRTESFPYKIPENWLWTRLSEIIDDVQPGFACGERDSQGIVQLRMNNINPRGDFIWDKILRVPFDEGLKQKFELKHGDILFNNTNSVELVGKSGLFKGFKEPIVFSNHFTRLRAVENRIDPAFVTLWLHSQWNSKVFEKICNKWIGQAAVNGNKLLAFQFPLPPLAEQHRIVAKVDRLMALCDELEARQNQERAGCLKLGTSSLTGLQNAENPEEFGRQWAQVCDAFDLILDCPENVKLLRQTILQLAVQGRLSTDGDIVGWKKEPLENLVTKVTNGYVGPTRFIYIASGIPYILSKHLKKNKIIFDGRTFISDEFNQKNQRSILQKGDVLLVQSGDIGNSAVVDDDHVGHNCHALIVMTPLKEKLNGHYLSIFFSSPEGRTKAIKIQTGMTLKHLNCRDVKRMIVPLPPLSEQHRIVAKVDALMALCDALESRLKEKAGVQGRLAGAVVRQVEGG